VTPRTLRKLRSYFSLVDHEPGRLRLRVSPRILLCREALRFRRFKGHRFRGILGRSFDPVSRIVTLEYDTDHLPPALVDDLVEARSDDEIASVADRVTSLIGIRLP